MTRPVLLLTIGPIQDFIAQARRTRDFWFGSHLLSELSRAAVKHLHDRGWEVVLPHLGAEEMLPCDAPLRPAEGDRPARPPVSVVNRVLARGPEGATESQAADMAKAARSSVQARWESLGNAVWETCSQKGVVDASDPRVRAVWDEQVGTFVEFQAAWMMAGEGAIGSARDSLEAAIAGRKMLRAFSPWRHSLGNVAKSSLDGARESLVSSRATTPKLNALRIAPAANRRTIGESLDAIGLIKRVGGDPEQFVPVANVAFSRWIDRARSENPGPFEALKKDCGGPVPFGAVNRASTPWTKAFPYDAQVFLEDRWPALFEEIGRGDRESARAWGRQVVGPVIARKPPYPYVAVLVADGDRMGETLNGLGPQELRAFSSELGQFAAVARKIVERHYQGALVYAGGDDVLALLPIPDALPCARLLRRVFRAQLARALPTGKAPGLSVGVAIGHVMESLGELFQMGRDAESLAKGKNLPASARGDALAVLVEKRTGSRRQWRDRWDRRPVRRMQAAMLSLDEQQSSGKVYEIDSLLRSLPSASVLAADEAARWDVVLRGELRRVLSGTPGKGEHALAAMGLSGAAGGYHSTREAIGAWVNRLLIARTLRHAEVSS